MLQGEEKDRKWWSTFVTTPSNDKILGDKLTTNPADDFIVRTCLSVYEDLQREKKV